MKCPFHPDTELAEQGSTPDSDGPLLICIQCDAIATPEFWVEIAALKRRVEKLENVLWKWCEFDDQIKEALNERE